MRFDTDSKPVLSWISDSSKSHSTRKNRKYMLGLYCLANGKTLETVKLHNSETWSTESVVKATNELIEEIRADKLGPYTSAQKFMDYMATVRKFASHTMAQLRSYVPDFLFSVVGFEDFSEKKFGSKVSTAKAFVETSKKVPTPEEVRQLISFTNLEYRAMIGVFHCLGWRINEVLSRKWTDLTFKPTGELIRSCLSHEKVQKDCEACKKANEYAVVHIKAVDTKAHYDRNGYLTSEVVSWLRKYSGDLGLKSPWLFPGYKGNRLTAAGASPNLKVLYHKVGLEDSEDAIYSSHSFRTYTDSFFSRCHLDRKFIDASIGHKAALASKFNYQDWRECEAQWLERCHNNLLIEKVERVEVVSPETLHLKDRIQELEEFNTHLKTLLGIETRPLGKRKPELLSPNELADKSDKTGVEGQ